MVARNGQGVHGAARGWLDPDRNADLKVDASLRISSLIEPPAAVAAHRPACADVTVSEMTAGDDGSVTHDQRGAARSASGAQVLQRRALAGR